MIHEVFDEQSLWSDDGHASELVLSALGDGQDALVPTRVIEHVDGCARCTERLSEVAVLAFSLDERLLELGAEVELEAEHGAKQPVARPAPAMPSRPFPLRPFALSLLVATVGLMPRLLGEGGVAARLFGLEHGGFGWLRSARLFVPLLLERERAFVMAVCLTTTLLACLGGWLLARSAELPKETLT